MEEKKGFLTRISEWFGNVNNVFASWATILLTVTGGFYMAWEFLDRWQARTVQQTEMEQAQSDQRQAFFLRQIWKSDLDSLNAQSSRDRAFYMEQIVKKDSIILVVIPKVVKSLQRVSSDLSKTNQKFDVILGKQVQNERVDVIKILNQRDSIAREQSKESDEIKALLEDIRRRSEEVSRDRPKFGDQVK